MHDKLVAKVNNIDASGFVSKLKRLNRKVNSNKRKHSLVENELIKLQTFDSGVLDIKVILKEMMLKIN